MHVVIRSHFVGIKGVKVPFRIYATAATAGCSVPTFLTSHKS